MDTSFGVLPIDPAHHLYAASVTTRDATTPASSDADLGGTFANPKMASFGTVRSANLAIAQDGPATERPA